MTAVLTPPPPVVQVTPEPYRFSVAQYHAMIAAGILPESNDEELFRGQIVRKPKRGLRHLHAARLVVHTMHRLLPSGWHDQVCGPITLADSEPEPAYAVIRGEIRDFATHHPGPADAGLVVEVSDSLLALDREGKRRLYAEAGAVAYWIVNVIDDVLEAYSDPRGGDYDTAQTFGPADSISPILDGVALPPIPVRDLLPGPAATPAAPPAGLEPYRLSVEQYHALIDAGILPESNEAEFCRGLVVRKMPKNQPHIAACNNVRRAIGARLPPGWFDQVQDPIVLADSEPEPDYSVGRGPVGDATVVKPGSIDVGLVVEVSDSSLAYDRGEKLRLYAENRVPVYWIVNLVDGVLEVYTQPHGVGDAAGYASVRTLRPDDSVTLTLDGVALPPIPVRALLP